MDAAEHLGWSPWPAEETPGLKRPSSLTYFAQMKIQSARFGDGVKRLLLQEATRRYESHTSLKMVLMM